MMRARPENISIRAGWPNMVWFTVLRYYSCKSVFFELLFLLLKSGDGEIIVHYCWENIVRVNFPFISFP